MSVNCNTICEKSCSFYYSISNSCPKCGACKRVCPANAIVNLDGKFTIDQSKCTKCGNCLKSCPLKFITLVE